jgi:aminobenzoyl-glutamate utilization protein B
MCQAAFDVLDRNADHVAAMAHCHGHESLITERARLPNHAGGGGHLPQF